MIFSQTVRYGNAAESTLSTQALNHLFHQLDPSFYANTILNVAEESNKQERQFAQRLPVYSHSRSGFRVIIKATIWIMRV